MLGEAGCAPSPTLAWPSGCPGQAAESGSWWGTTTEEGRRNTHSLCQLIYSSIENTTSFRARSSTVLAKKNKFSKKARGRKNTRRMVRNGLCACARVFPVRARFWMPRGDVVPSALRRSPALPAASRLCPRASESGSIHCGRTGAMPRGNTGERGWMARWFALADAFPREP